MTIRKVHIRYEDGQTNSSGYPFATGVTLQSLSMKTTANTDEGQIKLKVDKFSIQLFGGGGRYFFLLILSFSSEDILTQTPENSRPKRIQLG